MGRILIQNPNYTPTPNKVQSNTNEKLIIGSKSFGKIFEQKQQELKFSSHAQKRIQNRHMEIDKQELNRVQEGVNKLKTKGAKDSIVLVNEKAYVVSVKNSTVVTIIDNESLTDNVFTNIDSMIIL